MILPDVNMLIYAHVPGSVEYSQASVWWRECLEGEKLIGVPEIVIGGFLRMTTNKRIFKNPFSPEAASDIVSGWLSQQNVKLLIRDEFYIQKLVRRIKDFNLSGNAVPDAQLAVYALQNDAVLHTADSGFKQFPDLKWFNPLTGDSSRNLVASEDNPSPPSSPPPSGVI